MNLRVFFCVTVIFAAVLAHVTAMSVREANGPWRRNEGKLLFKLYKFRGRGHAYFQKKKLVNRLLNSQWYRCCSNKEKRIIGNLRSGKLQDTKYRTKWIAVTLTSRIGVSKKHFAFMNIQSGNSSICSQVSSFKFMNVFYCKALIGENIYVQAAIFLWIISNWETISLAINDKDAQSWICYLGCWFFFNFSRWEKKKCLCLLALFLRLLNLIASLMWSHFFLFISI